MIIKQLLSLLLFFFVCQTALPAQSMAVSEPMSLRNDYGYEIIGRLRERVLLFRDKYDEFEVLAFDNQMHIAWSKTLEDLDQRGLQVLAVVGGKNDFSIIHRLRRRGGTQLRVHKYDPGAGLIDSMTLKTYGERVFTPPVLEVLRSEDRNCFIVFNTAERGSLEITCFRLDKMQVLWDKVVKLDEDTYADDIKAMTLSNNGDLFLVLERNNRRARAEDHELQVLQVGAGPDRLTRIPLTDVLTHDLKFIFDNKNLRVVGAGLYAEKNRERANGTFFVTFNPGATTSPVVQLAPFDDNFLSILRQKDVSDDNRGISDADVRQVVLRQDGGVLLIAERHHEIQRGSSSTRGFWRDGAHIVVDFYYDDVFVVAMEPDGRVHWNTALHKKQYSQDDDANFSSYFLFRNPDKLRLLFNDEIKYENTCSEYILSPAGEFDRNSLLTTEGQNLRLRFRDGLQISAGECIVPSEFRNKLRLVLLHF